MRPFKLYLYLLFASTLIINQTFGQVETTRIDDSFNWSRILPYKISKDNKWLHTNQFYSDPAKPLLAFYINTQTNEIITSNTHDLLANNIMVAKKSDIITLKDLDNTSILKTINNIVTFKSIPSRSIIITTDASNVLSVQEVSKDLNKLKVLFSSKDVHNFIVSPNNEKIIYQKKNEPTDIYYLNTLTWQNKKISSFKEQSLAVTWSTNQDSFTILHQDNSISIFNLSTLRFNNIQLEDSKKVKNIKIQYFTNNDLYVEYNIVTDKNFPETEYLDIWNGNTKNLYPSDFTLKHEIHKKAFIYINKLNKSIPLEPQEDKLYFHIGIPNYILTYNPLENKNFESNTAPTRKFSLLDIRNNKIIAVFPSTKMPNLIKVSKDEKHILFSTTDQGVWSIFSFKENNFFNFSTNTFQETSFTPTWSEDSKKVYFQKGKDLVRLYVDKKNIEIITNLETQNNKIKLVSGFNYNNSNQYLNDSYSFIFTSIDPIQSNLFSFKNNKLRKLYSTTNLIKTINNFDTQNHTSLAFTEENFNQAPIIKTLINNHVNTIKYTYIPDSMYNWRKIKEFTFNDKFGEDIKGFLKYPKNFDASKKYPMIIEIYDKYNHLLKQFINVSQMHDMQINDPFYNEKGYFVCKINTYVSKEGPGLAATDITLKGLEKALSIEPSINPNKIGLFGFSFGGYKTSFIATQTERFTTIVSGGASHDLIGGQTYRYSYQRHIPDWEMSENGQMQLRDSYKDNPSKYIANSPLLHAQNINTPILLYAGLEDKNVPSENTSKMFIALLKYQKPVIALFYKNVSHGFLSSNKKQYIDFDKRLLDWFDYHLKDKKDIDWINQGLNTNEHSVSELEDF